MDISRHAAERLKERCGLNKKACERMAQKAFDNGIRHSQTKGRLNKWVTVIQIPVGLMKDFKEMLK